MELSPGARIENRGTIMHLSADAVSDVTVISYGTIMNTNGCRIINNGLHTSAVKEIIREVPRQQDLQRIEELEKECARLRAQNQHLQNLEPEDQDIHWGRKRIKDQRRKIEELTHKVDFLRNEVKNRDNEIERYKQTINEMRGRDIIRRMDSENETLHEQIGFYEGQIINFRKHIAYLQEQLDGTDRQQLIDTIEDLREKLKRSKNRETVQKQRAYYESMRARIATQQVWDEYKPTKEQVKSYFRKITNMMDCETDY